jgi:hypothetical protein
MKKQARRITLHRETLLHLDEVSARIAGGRITFIKCTTTADCTLTCGETCFTICGCTTTTTQ